MRIVHLVSSGQLGGTEASVIEMIRSVLLARPAWQISVTTPENGALARRLEAQRIPVEVLEFPRRFAAIGEAGAAPAGTSRLLAGLAAALPGIVAYRGALMRALDRNGSPPGVVHAHGFKMQILSALALPSRSRLLWHVHDYVSARPVSARLLRGLSSRVSAMVANSDSVAADMRRVCGDDIPLTTIYNGVDLAAFAPSGPRLDLDACAGVAPAPAGTVRIGLVATFGLWKGHRTFLAAVAALRTRRPVRAYLIGGAQYQTAGSQLSEAALRAEAARLGIAGTVAFTGAVTNPAAAMRALDVVVHASTQPEPFGMVIAEAMASGRAVVISGAGGATELVVEGIDGLAHPPGDHLALARCLDRLIDDGDLRARLGAAARATAERRFDRDRLAGQLVPLYAGLAP